MDNETRSLPMVALRGLTIMPEMIVHFDVSRERSIAAIQQAMVEEQEIFLVAQKSIETDWNSCICEAADQAVKESCKGSRGRKESCGS